MPDSASTVPGAAPGSNVDRCVLVVDDHPHALYAKRRILAHAGFRVLEAKTGNEALLMVSEHRPAVVVLDVRLPDVDGFAVCRAIKENPATAGTMVLQVSAYCTSIEDQVVGLDNGADAYLPGDVAPSLLTAVVRALLRTRLAERTVHEQAERLRWAQAVEESEEKLRALAARLLTVQEDERRRIGREVHDDVCQRLASVEIELARVRQRSPELEPELGSVSRELAGVSNTLRTMSHALHPAVVEHLGISVGLRTLCEDFERMHDLATKCVCSTDEREVPPTVAITLYRIAQEALRNVVKHAGDACASVTLIEDEAGLCLTVQDDGCGFDVSRRRNSGVGLTSMQERASLVGGELRVISAPGQGTTVDVHVPWPSKTA